MENITINGIRVFEHPLMDHLKEQVQFRFPKSKKKRIRDKWRKYSRNYRFVSKAIYMQQGDKIFVDAETYYKLMTDERFRQQMVPATKA